MRLRGLLMRTSAAAGAPHLMLANAYARLTALAAQLRQLQKAAAPTPPAVPGDPAALKLAVDSAEVLPCHVTSEPSTCLLLCMSYGLARRPLPLSSGLRGACRMPRRQRSQLQRRLSCFYNAQNPRNCR